MRCRWLTCGYREQRKSLSGKEFPGKAKKINRKIFWLVVENLREELLRTFRVRLIEKFV